MSKIGDLEDDVEPEPADDISSPSQPNLSGVKNGPYIFHSLLRRLPDYDFLSSSTIEMPEDDLLKLELNFD